MHTHTNNIFFFLCFHLIFFPSGMQRRLGLIRVHSQRPAKTLNPNNQWVLHFGFSRNILLLASALGSMGKKGQSIYCSYGRSVGYILPFGMVRVRFSSTWNNSAHTLSSQLAYTFISLSLLACCLKLIPF